MLYFSKRSVALVVLAVLIPFTSFANGSRNVTLFAGGGCFATLREEMASEALRYSKTMTANGWEVLTLFGGLDLVRGRDNTSDVNLLGVLPFNRGNFISILEAQARELKEGDQFLLTILTHGRYKRGGHLLCLGDGSGLDLSDSAIRQLLRKMSDHGVRVAVMDNSCYGGQTVGILSESACVLATQTADFPSLIGAGLNQNGATSIALDLLEGSGKPGALTIEDVYLATGIQHPAKAVFPVLSGLDHHNEVGNDLAWLIMAEEMMLDRYRGHECKDQDRCRANVAPIRRMGNRRSLNRWMSKQDSQDRSVVNSHLFALQSLNDQIRTLQEEVDDHLSGKKLSGFTDNIAEWSAIPGLSSGQFPPMESLMALRAKKSSLLDDFSKELKRIRSKEYQLHRSEWVNPQIDSCRRFQLKLK